MNKVIVIDLGASSGRLMIAELDQGKIKLNEIHRFSNEMIEKHGHYYWDIDMIFAEIKAGLQKVDGPVASIGVDTWGVDVGLISQGGKLLDRPFSYRDTHTVPAMEVVDQKISRQELFQRTSVEPASINTLYQLQAIFSKHPDWLEQIEVILTMPNVINFLLTGEQKNEFTHASTTQLLNGETKQWDEHVMETVFGQQLPLAPLNQTNTVLGKTSAQVNKKTGLAVTNVIQVPGHDTACALASMPRISNDSAFMSSGTWVLIGVEVTNPVVTDKAYEWGFTNEGTAEQTYRLQKNNMGLWLLQQCKVDWSREGKHVSYKEEEKLIHGAEPFRSFIDPDDDLFFNPDRMTTAIQTFCKQTNQAIPEEKGDFLRCIVESLALKYRWVIDRMESLTNRDIPSIHMAGGGIQNTSLCQFTANATGKTVQAGPIEASSLGNALSQFISLGAIDDWGRAKDITRHSFPIKEYQPFDQHAWEMAYKRFEKVVTN